MSISGTLSTFQCNQYTYPIFTSGDLKSTKCIAFIGGLTAGLGSVPYMSRLSDALGEVGLKLVQFHWSSGYDGYENGSISRDAEEMFTLARHLQEEGMTDLVWMGNSTGCQDIAYYLSHPTYNKIGSIVRGGILQAPVSDREGTKRTIEEGDVNTKSEKELILSCVKEAERRMLDNTGSASQKAREMDEVVPDVRKRCGGRLTWARLFDLYGIGGMDDYFSSDLPSSPTTNTDNHAHPLSSSFGKFTVPTLTLWSEADQFAWKGLDTPSERMKRWAKACPVEAPLSWKSIQGADHEVTEIPAQEVMIEEVIGWLRSIDLIET